MNTKLYNMLMNVTRKNVSDTWAAEDFISIGFVRGELQPAGGTLSTKSGRASSNATFVYYCKPDADIETGDILYDAVGRGYVVMSMDIAAYNGQADHLECGLVYQ